MSDQPWARAFRTLEALPPGASTQAKAARGRKFEHVLSQLLAQSDLDPRTSYRPTGEEIDGSFILDGRCLLLEAKWTRDPIPASTLYQFRGKIEGKLVGTVGVIISMSDYSSDAVEALMAGKTLNMVLVTGAEMQTLARGCSDFPTMIRFKLRAAAEEGTPLAPWVPDCATETDEPLSSARALIVEGQSDMMLFGRLLSGAREDFSDLHFLTAFGRSNLGPVAQLYEKKRQLTFREVLVVADGDGAGDRIREEIAEAVPELPEDSIFILEPDIEGVLGVDRDWWRQNPWGVEAPRGPELDRLWERAEGDVEFSRLLRKLGASRGSS